MGIITLNIDKLKQMKLAEMADKRWQAETEGYVYNGQTFHADRQSQDRVFQAYVASLNNPNFTQTWKTKDGWLEMTVTDFVNLYNEFQAFLQGLYQKEKALQEQIDGATTVAELEAVKWE